MKINNSGNRSKSLSSQTTVVTLIIALILVVFTPTYFTNQIANLKSLVVFATTIILILIFCFTSLRRKQLSLTRSPLTLPLIFFGLSTLIVTLIKFPTAPQENLLGFAGLFLSLSVITVLGSTLIKVRNGKLIITTITTIATLVSIITFLRALSVVFPTHLNSLGMSYLNIGTPLTIFALILVAIAGSAAMYVKKGRLIRPYNFFLPLLILGLLSTFIVAFGEYNAAKPLIMSPRLSWETALNTLELKSPGLEQASGQLPGSTATFNQKLNQWLVGSGSESYGDIYNLYKPAWVLQTKWSDFHFTKGFDLPLTLIPTLGVIVTLAWFWVFIRSCAEFKNQNGDNSYLFLMPAVAFALQLFIPADPIIIFIEAILLAFSANYGKQSALNLTANPDPESQRLTNSQSIIYFLCLILILGLTSWGAFSLGKNYLAFAADQKSINTYQSTDYDLTRDLEIYYKNANQAVQFSTDIDLVDRHAALANLELALQSVQASREVIPTNQVDKSISYSRLATEIRPARATNWETLGHIYQEIAPLTDLPAQTYQLAIDAYQQQILLDPFNITPYLSIGGIFYSQGKPAEAIVFFQKAVDLRPDSALAYYNLARAYSQTEEKELAYQAYQVALSLLKTSEPDYQANMVLINQEINALNLTPAQIPGAPTNLLQTIEK